MDTRLVIGEPAPLLADLGLSALMLVVSAQGATSRPTGPLGSVSRYLATHARCPVVIARGSSAVEHGGVVLGVRDPDDAEGHLAFAFEEAACRRAHLLVIQAWQWVRPAGPGHHAVAPAHISAGALTRMSSLLDAWREKHPDVEVGEEVIHGRGAPALAQLSSAADLVVLGRHHHSMANTDAPLGSATLDVLGHAQCPVAIVPATGDGG